MKRNPQIAKRRAEALEVHRVKALNKDNVDNYFIFLKSIIEKVTSLNQKPLTASSFINFDEMGRALDRVQRQILAPKGARDVSVICTGTRQHTSVVSTIAADGTCLPPFFIVKGKRDVAGFFVLFLFFVFFFFGKFLFLFLFCFCFCFVLFLFNNRLFKQCSAEL